MSIDRTRRYETAEPFFELGGSVVMILSTDAAISVCLLAASRGLVIARVEGGLWHSPGFEARVDCIWDGIDPPASGEQADENNRLAAEFIRDESGVHDAFVLTAPSIGGW